MNIVITGANGFIGRNLVTHLQATAKHRLTLITRASSPTDLEQGLATADVVYHLAGVNRPQTEEEFHTGNALLTAQLCQRLLEMGRPVPIVLASSTQATLDTPYGRSKREAEEVVAGYATKSGAGVFIYRLTNVFGKWSRPNYNSVIATFCYNIGRVLPITVSDPSRVLDLVYIDDVVAHFVANLADAAGPGVYTREATPVYQVTLGELADQLLTFRAVRESLRLSDFADEFTRKLYATYLSYLDEGGFSYALEKKCDERGCLTEFIKAPAMGQIFVSRTAPGVTRGNHFHHTKTEKFLVLEGEAVIRFRPIGGDQVIEYRVGGHEFRVVDIPPGYTHSIENVGTGELVTLFWASELFDPGHPDTYYEKVLTA